MARIYKTKKFGNERFRIGTAHSHMSDAKRVAKKLRHRGYKARIARKKGCIKYAVYYKNR